MHRMGSEPHDDWPRPLPLEFGGDCQALVAPALLGIIVGKS